MCPKVVVPRENVCCAQGMSFPQECLGLLDFTWVGLCLKVAVPGDVRNFCRVRVCVLPNEWLPKHSISRGKFIHACPSPLIRMCVCSTLVLVCYLKEVLPLRCRRASRKCYPRAVLSIPQGCSALGMVRHLKEVLPLRCHCASRRCYPRDVLSVLPLR